MSTPTQSAHYTLWPLIISTMSLAQDVSYCFLGPHPLALDIFFS